MKKDEKVILQDMQAYMQWCMENGITLGECLMNIAHDLGGILSQEKCFCPRTAGYRERMAEVR